MFKTNIIEIGKSANYFREQGLLILFSDLTEGISVDYCYKIESQPVLEKIQPGMSVMIGDEAYEITAVGDKVQFNLTKYGHITMRFDGSKEAVMPGTVYLEDKSLPEIECGMEVKIA